MKNCIINDLPHEVWRDVVGYEGLYEVSSLGRVRSVDRIGLYASKPRRFRGRLLKPTNRNGYLAIALNRNKTRIERYVHRLVAMAFIPNPNNYPQVNHKDETRNNNNVNNLEWCDNKYNNNYGTKVQRMIEKRGFPVSQYLLDGTFIKSYESTHSAARATGIARGNISAAAKGAREFNGKSFCTRRTAGGFLWKKDK